MQQFVAKTSPFEANTRALSKMDGGHCCRDKHTFNCGSCPGESGVFGLKACDTRYISTLETHVKIKQNQSIRRIAATCATAMSMAFGASLAAAEPAATSQTAANDPISIELNKLDSTDKGCRAVLVINNPTDETYSALKLDLVMFEGGVFTRRVALDLAPVKAQKRSVKLFDLEGLSCDKISEFLINDVMECKTGAGAEDSCLKRLSVSSLTKAKLSK